MPLCFAFLNILLSNRVQQVARIVIKPGGKSVNSTPLLPKDTPSAPLRRFPYGPLFATVVTGILLLAAVNGIGMDDANSRYVPRITTETVGTVFLAGAFVSWAVWIWKRRSPSAKLTWWDIPRVLVSLALIFFALWAALYTLIATFMVA